MNQALFNTVSKKDYLGYTSSTSDLKKIGKFLDLEKNDISKATSQ